MLAPPKRSPRIRTRFLVVGLVSVLVALAAVWVAGFRTTLEVVAVTGVPHCEGTEPTVENDLDSSFRRVAIPTTEGFACMLSISVNNRSDHDITLGRVTVPIGGPMAAASFEVLSIDGGKPAADQIDAIVDLDQPIGSGDRYVLEVRVGFRESGCGSQGTWTGVDPRIEVKDLFASHDLLVTDLPLFAGTADSSCDT